MRYLYPPSLHMPQPPRFTASPWVPVHKSEADYRLRTKVYKSIRTRARMIQQHGGSMNCRDLELTLLRTYHAEINQLRKAGRID